MCPLTSTVNAPVTLGTGADEFTDACTRMFCEAGTPRLLFIDRQSGLVKMTDNIEYFLSDVQGKISKVSGISTQLCPVAGHNFRRKIKRIGRTLKDTLDKTGINK